MIFLDTNVVSEMMKGQMDEAPRRWVARQDVSEFWLTVVTVAELRYGAHLLTDEARRAKLLAEIDRMIGDDFSYRVADFGIEATVAYAEIAAHRRLIGKPFRPLDIQIAALARLHGGSVATRNVRDFVDCGVEVIDPWAA